MSVLKNLQNLSDLEFYKCAEKLQDDITDFALRNFGLKRSPRSVNQIIKDIEETDQEIINGIFEKYGRKPNQGFSSEFPEWFIDNRKLHLIATFDTADNAGRSVGIGSQISQVAGIFYPTRIDNYCKIVRSVKYYGRYMDDTYIIHNDKQYLRELLHDIQLICDDLGIIINKKKTQIIKLSNGFTFLKMRYLITDTGKIIVIPCKASITRERRKLRKLKGKLDAGKIAYSDIAGQYKSWRGNLTKYNAYKSVRHTDALYKSLFGGYYGKEEKGIN